MHILL